MPSEFLPITYGSSGPYVEMVQLALARAGTKPGFIDGVFGTSTGQALTGFQRAQGLSPDGILGPATWQRLRPYITGYFTVSVRPGDTFYRIARRYGTTTEAMITANPTVNPLELQTGQHLTVPLSFFIVPTTIRYTSLLVSLCLEGLGARYPFIRTGRIGSSVLGQPLLSAEIGVGEKTVFYNASHHANEWITTPLLLRFLESYGDAYANDKILFDTDARVLYRGCTVKIVPLVNPDGVDLVTGAISRGTAYDDALRISENYPDIPFPSGWKANITGTDLNLNYPAEWDRAREIKISQGFTGPAPRDYVGTAPLSAPESRAVYEYTRAQNFERILSYHTQGKVIYWKFLNYNPPGALELGRRLSAVSGYQLEETPYASGFAGYKDWFIQTYNLPGYTIEAGSGVSPLPLSQFSQIYRDNLGILTETAKF